MVPCSGELCPDGKLDDAILGFELLWENKWILLVQFFLCLNICVLFCNSMFVVKYASATQKVIMDSCAAIVVWCFFLTFPKGNAVHEEFEWI